jgi:predicted aconitase with swiveling domain
MTTSLVLPTDNAVIDYSIISQMIAVINSQQQQIDTYLKTISTVDPSTGKTTTSAQKTVGNHVAPADATGKLFTVSYSSMGLSTVNSIVGIPYTGGSTTTSCWIFSIKSGTEIQFKTSAPAKYLYYIAVGS